LMDAVGRSGGYRLSPQQVEALSAAAFQPAEGNAGARKGGVSRRDVHVVVRKELIGQDPAVLADRIGLAVPAGTQLLFGETDAEHPFVSEEQMMPFVPFVRCRCADEAIDLAKQSEHNFRHTAIIHSRNVHTMTRMGRELDTTLFVKNGPCMAGLGLGGEGFLSYSIATPTGEGVTSPLTFTRQRRCTMVDELRIV
jgi:aldehyde dehydrogenase